MKLVQGKGASAGVAAGPILVKPAGRQPEIRLDTCLDPQQELKRLQAAQQQVIEILEGLKEKARQQVGEEEAGIFEVHQMMVQDPDLCDTITGLIQENHMTAEGAVREAGSQFAAMLEAMDDEYMQARGADVRAVCGQLEDALAQGGRSWTELLTQPSIICADDLTPSETLQLDKSLILGFVTSGGSANSHTAILARTMKIPAIVHTGITLDEDWNGTLGALDGGTGNFWLDPEPQVLEALKEKQQQHRAAEDALEQFRGKPTCTADGRTIALYGNIGQPEDIDLVLQNDGEGVGLFRSEFLYLGREDYPTEDELFEAYCTAAQELEGRKLIIRTLDIGADKKVGYFQLPEEENPALGFRAIRICLKRPEIFLTQLRAILRASAYGEVAVMFPMIVSVEEVKAARALLEQAAASLRAGGIPFDEKLEVGIMIETPAAAIISDDLAQYVDFFSIGTNDLTQYTLAVDRQNASLEELGKASHKAVLRLIDLTIRNGHAGGCWVGICGEAAADPELIPYFVAMGVDELSMSPGKILGARKLISTLRAE
ncbi:phosphoenolpyruvate--protein phosphotransferase [Acidaminococcus fermentans]|uniref:Phosphoenolpyruvate-protein phosphotransferase n=1 Tax=Acidaminococcus fermentans TaxID=905 RepID=A0A6N7VMA3_ACIFE|nr:phosphoenolpyruvate--protein phosphotransferase [Acidaminococcus fermentans]MSS82844.1 phosphoenolpyruvate--protein phosphotransferase [Acidaminococcus fermentans]